MDRFKPLAWDYDEALERNGCGNEAWANRVIQWRANCARAGIEHIISPRASFDGAAMLAQGMDEATTIAVCVRKALTDSQWRQIA